MRKRALAVWPRKKEPEQVYEPVQWVQEEEVQKTVFAINRKNPRERLQQIVPGIDLKRFIL